MVINLFIIMIRVGTWFKSIDNSEGPDHNVGNTMEETIRLIRSNDHRIGVHDFHAICRDVT